MKKLVYLIVGLMVAAATLVGCQDENDLPQLPDSPEQPEIPGEDPEDDDSVAGDTGRVVHDIIDYASSVSFIIDIIDSDSVSLLDPANSDNIIGEELEMIIGEGRYKKTYKVRWNSQWHLYLNRYVAPESRALNESMDFEHREVYDNDNKPTGKWLLRGGWWPRYETNDETVVLVWNDDSDRTDTLRITAQMPEMLQETQQLWLNGERVSTPYFMLVK